MHTSAETSTSWSFATRRRPRRRAVCAARNRAHAAVVIDVTRGRLTSAAAIAARCLRSPVPAPDRERRRRRSPYTPGDGSDRHAKVARDCRAARARTACGRRRNRRHAPAPQRRSNRRRPGGQRDDAGRHGRACRDRARPIDVRDSGRGIGEHARTRGRGHRRTPRPISSAVTKTFRESGAECSSAWTMALRASCAARGDPRRAPQSPPPRRPPAPVCQARRRPRATTSNAIAAAATAHPIASAASSARARRVVDAIERSIARTSGDTLHLARRCGVMPARPPHPPLDGHQQQHGDPEPAPVVLVHVLQPHRRRRQRRPRPGAEVGLGNRHHFRASGNRPLGQRIRNRANQQRRRDSPMPGRCWQRRYDRAPPRRTRAARRRPRAQSAARDRARTARPSRRAEPGGPLAAGRSRSRSAR